MDNVIKLKRLIEETQNDYEYLTGLATDFLEEYPDYDKETIDDFRWDFWTAVEQFRRSFDDLDNGFDVLFSNNSKNDQRIKKKGFEKLLPKEVGEEYEFKSDGAELHIWRVT